MEAPGNLKVVVGVFNEKLKVNGRKAEKLYCVLRKLK